MNNNNYIKNYVGALGTVYTDHVWKAKTALERGNVIYCIWLYITFWWMVDYGWIWAFFKMDEFAERLEEEAKKEEQKSLSINSPKVGLIVGCVAVAGIIWKIIDNNCSDND